MSLTKGTVQCEAMEKLARDFAGELVLDWINEVIDKINVYDKDRVEIAWKFE